MLGKPARRLGLRDDGEDVDRFGRDVMEDSHLPDPQPILGLAQAPPATCPSILHRMTRALDAAIAKLSGLPAEEQDRIARWLLDELEDEELWSRQFAASQDALSKLAAEARADRVAGRATEDPDQL